MWAETPLVPISGVENIGMCWCSPTGGERCVKNRVPASQVEQKLIPWPLVNKICLAGYIYEV